MDALRDACDGVVLGLDRALEHGVVHRRAERHDGGARRVADFGLRDLGQRLERLLHGRLTVTAHHAFDGNGLFHSCFLLDFGYFFEMVCAFMIVARIAQPEQIQAQGVRDHAEARQAHGCRAEHGVERQAERDEHARRDGDADGVVEKRPEQVLVDVAQRRAAEPDGRRDVAQAAVDEHDVGRVDGHVRARADGDADVRARERRRVVDAVADHGDLAACAQAADLALLTVGQHARDHLVHAGLRADGFRRARVVACDHDDTDAHVPQLADGLRAVGLEHVGHGDDAEQLPASGKKQRRLAGLRERFRLRLHGRGDLGHGAEEVRVAAAERLPVEHGAQTVARQGLKVRDLGGGQPVRLRAAQHRLGQWVLAPALERAGQAQQLALRHAGGRTDVRHGRVAGGDGASLVERDDLDAAGLLEGGGRLEENAVFRAHAAADHDRHRCGEAERARAADDEHGDAARERIAHAAPQQQPDNERHERDAHDRRHEHAGHLVGDLRDRRLRGRRVADHLDDLRKGCVLADARGAAFQEARLVHRRGRDGRARRLVGRDTLARERRLVDRARALEHHAVDRDALARADEEHVALLHLLDRDGHLRAAALDGGGLRREFHEAAQRVGRFALRAGLERLAHRDEREDHGGGLKVKVHHVVHDGLLVAAHLRARHGKERIRAVHERRRRPERHERVHVRCTVPERLIAADEKLLVDDHDDHRQQQLRQAHGDMVAVIKLRQRPAPHHVAHGKIHQHEQKAQRPEKSAPQLRRLVVGERVRVRGAGARLRALDRCAVARGLHRVDDGLIRCRALHPHGVGQQADRACRHARHI